MEALILSMILLFFLVAVMFLFNKNSKILDESKKLLVSTGESLDVWSKRGASDEDLKGLQDNWNNQRKIHRGLRSRSAGLAIAAILLGAALFIILNIMLLSNFADRERDNACQCTVENRIDRFFYIDFN